jgi:hypothetical protein
MKQDGQNCSALKLVKPVTINFGYLPLVISFAIVWSCMFDVPS